MKSDMGSHSRALPLQIWSNQCKLLCGLNINGMPSNSRTSSAEAEYRRRRDGRDFGNLCRSYGCRLHLGIAAFVVLSHRTSEKATTFQSRIRSTHSIHFPNFMSGPQMCRIGKFMRTEGNDAETRSYWGKCGGQRRDRSHHRVMESVTYRF